MKGGVSRPNKRHRHHRHRHRHRLYDCNYHRRRRRRQHHPYRLHHHLCVWLFGGCFRGIQNGVLAKSMPSKGKKITQP